MEEGPGPGELGSDPQSPTGSAAETTELHPAMRGHSSDSNEGSTECGARE